MVYVRGLSAQAIAHETGLRREQVLRAVLTLRRLLQREVPPVFQGTVEIDEAYVGSRWRNCRQARKALGSKHGRGTSKIPVFGILCRGGQVWAQGVPDLAVRTLFP
jgi:transposase